jgi:hypothetical protein
MRYLTLMVLFVVVGVSYAQLPEIPQIDDTGIDEQIGQANQLSEGIPDIDPDLIPNETATSLFSYMKWMFSDTSAKELVGETLSPILINLYVWFLIAITFTTIWLIVRFVIFLWRFVLWVISWIIKLVELIPFM